MNRRAFLVGCGTVAVHARSSLAQARAPDASLQFGAVNPMPVPADFTGLSYESAQLANPAFFSPANKQLIGLFRELTPRGNLRLGGGSSEFTTYSPEAPAAPPPFEVFGPDTSKTVKQGTITSALALHNLRGFLDEVNWSCLYGLNLGQGSVENAVSEAAAAQSILGPRLLAFQIGNEPDSFRNRYRPAGYSPVDYIAEWIKFHDAIVRAAPDAKFGGPDISNKLPYLTAFAELAPKYPDVMLLTSHYYAMGPASNPDATISNLLEPDPKLTTLKRRDLHVIAEACETAHLPYRMSEGNSCWDGGKAGVSDTFASALWCANYMLSCMARGWAGVNLHGGGNGFYTPIAGTPSMGLTRRPEFFGMLFAQRFTSAHFVESILTGADARVEAFLFERDGARELAIINKTASTVQVALPMQPHGRAWGARLSLRLTAPDVAAKEHIELKAIQHERIEARVSVPPYTASAYALEANHRNGREA